MKLAKGTLTGKRGWWRRLVLGTIFCCVAFLGGDGKLFGFRALAASLESIGTTGLGFFLFILLAPIFLFLWDEGATRLPPRKWHFEKLRRTVFVYLWLFLLVYGYEISYGVRNQILHAASTVRLPDLPSAPSPPPWDDEKEKIERTNRARRRVNELFAAAMEDSRLAFDELTRVARGPDPDLAGLGRTEVLSVISITTLSIDTRFEPW
jgi:hypothetical protein